MNYMEDNLSHDLNYALISLEKQDTWTTFDDNIIYVY